MNALVTGGGGFLGRYIVEQLLERGDRVRVLGRGDYAGYFSNEVALIRADIQDSAAVTQACRGVDTVFHAAAKAGYWGRYEHYYGPNVQGTRNVLAACREAGVQRLVYTSSPSVVFNNRPQEGCNESLPYPQSYENHYSATKAAAERLVLQANRDDLLTVVLRPHLIWGARDTQILPRLIARARRGRVPQVGDGRNRVDLTYVEDAARAHLDAADSLLPGAPCAGSVYFISQDEPVLLWDWIANLFARLDIPPVKQKFSLPVARAAGGLLEGMHRLLRLPGEPRLTRFLASELAMSHYYDISRAKRDLNYRPRFSMAEALEKTLPWLRENA